jgi:hypothetical protein
LSLFFLGLFPLQRLAPAVAAAEFAGPAAVIEL